MPSKYGLVFFVFHNNTQILAPVLWLVELTHCFGWIFELFESDNVPHIAFLL